MSCAVIKPANYFFIGDRCKSDQEAIAGDKGSYRQLFVLTEAIYQLFDRCGVVLLETFLIDVDEIIGDVGLDAVDVCAPLAQALHFERYIEVFLPFGFNDEDAFVGEFDKKVGIIVGNIAVGVDIVELEMDGEIIFGVGDDVAAIFEKAGKDKFKMAVADDAVEDAFLGDEIALVFCDEGTGLTQLDGVSNFGVAFILHSEIVDGFFKGLDQCACGGQFGEVAQRVGVFEIDGAIKEIVAHKGFDFGIEHIVTANQTQIAHDGLGKKANDAAIVGNTSRIKHGGVSCFTGGDVFEDDLTLFFFAELQIGNTLVRSCPGIQICQIFIFTVDPAVSSLESRCRAPRCPFSRSLCPLLPPAVPLPGCPAPLVGARAPHLRPGSIRQSP